MKNPLSFFVTEASVEFMMNNLRVVKDGKFVRCAITGKQINLDELNYWNVEKQEGYSTPQAVLESLKEERKIS